MDTVLKETPDNTIDSLSRARMKFGVPQVDLVDLGRWCVCDLGVILKKVLVFVAVSYVNGL